MQQIFKTDTNYDFLGAADSTEALLSGGALSGGSVSNSHTRTLMWPEEKAMESEGRLKQSTDTSVTRQSISRTNCHSKHGLVYMTSIRELVHDERVGCVDMNGQIRHGLLEALTADLQRGGALQASFTLNAIVCDDSEEEWQLAWQAGEPWPSELVVPSCSRKDLAPCMAKERTLSSLVKRVSSHPWRALRREAGEEPLAFKDRKAARKRTYELQLAAALEAANCDVVLCDSHLCILSEELLSRFEGRLLNVHPAITDLQSPHRLPGRTPSLDAYTRAVYGYVFVDDKLKAAGLAGLKRFEVEWDGRLRPAVSVPRSTIHGVTVHRMSTKVDEGEVLLSETFDLIHDARLQDLSVEVIRILTYRVKVGGIVTRALLHWAHLIHTT